MSDASGPAPSAPKYDLLSPAFFADPHTTFHRMRAEDPIYWHPLLNFWVLTRYDDIQTISRDPRFSAVRQAQLGTGVSEAMVPQLEVCLQFVSHWMIFRDPPRHTILHGLVAKAFTPQVIEGLRPDSALPARRSARARHVAARVQGHVRGAGVGRRRARVPGRGRRPAGGDMRSDRERQGGHGALTRGLAA